MRLFRSFYNPHLPFKLSLYFSYIPVLSLSSGSLVLVLLLSSSPPSPAYLAWYFCKIIVGKKDCSNLRTVVRVGVG